MNYYDLDRVGQALFRLNPDKYGLYPRDSETYIALAVRNYFIDLSQQERAEKMKWLYSMAMIKPAPQITASDVVGVIDHEELSLTVADAEEMVQGNLELMKDQRMLDAGYDDDEDDVINMDLLISLVSEAMQRTYELFDSKKMSANLEEFIRQMYIIVMNGQ